MNKLWLNSVSLNGTRLNAELRKEGRGSGGPSEYVQEGLIFELDCKKGVGTYTWKSRRCNDMPSFEFISGYPYYNSETAEYDIQRLPLHKDVAGVLFEYKEVVTEEGAGTVPTVLINKRLPFPIEQYEVCFKVTSQWSLSLSVLQQYTANFFNWSNETYPQLEPGELCTISHNRESGETYINGVPLSSSRMARRSSNAGIADFDFIFLSGVGLTLYEFRYYENSLSDDDVKYNYSIDQKRFVTPPVPENALVDNGSYLVDGGYFVVDNN